MEKPPVRIFDDRSQRLIAETVRRVLTGGYIPAGQPGTPIANPPRLLVVINESGEEIPPFALMPVSQTYTETDGVLLAGVTKADATFRRVCLLNGPAPIAAGEAAELPAGQPIGETDWAPAPGDAGGPKPGSWKIAKGFPAACDTIGRAPLQDSGATYATVFLHSIVSFEAKATAAIASGSNTATNYQILAAGVDTGFTTKPTLYNPGGEIANGARFAAIFAGDRWIAASGSGAAPSTEQITVVTAYRIDGATRKLQYKTRTVDAINPSVETGWIDAHTGTPCP